MKRRLANGKKQPLVVEIGCGYGDVGRLVQPWADFIGFEPSVSLHKIARDRGLDARCEVYCAAKLPQAADAIVIDNTLEHVIDPSGMLRDAVNGLAAGGILVVIVPNRHDLRALSASWRARHLWVPPDHINYFAPRDLARLFSDLGLRMRCFGLGALRPWKDAKFFPRALAEEAGMPLFGLNVWATKPSRPSC